MKFCQIAVSAFLAVAMFSNLSASAEDGYALSESQKKEALAIVRQMTGIPETFEEENAVLLNAKGYDIDGAFIVYNVLFHEPLELPVSGQGNIMIPYQNANACGMFELGYKENQLVFKTRSIGDEFKNAFVVYREDIRNHIDNISAETEIHTVQYLSDPIMHIDAVLIDTASDAYIIPYAAPLYVQTYADVSSGEIYRAQDFRNWAVNAFEYVPPCDAEGNLLFGQSPYHYTGSVDLHPYVFESDADSQAFPIDTAVPGVLSLSAAGGCVYVFSRKQKQD